jgi:glutathione S-transferase
MYTLIGSPKSRGFRVMWMLEEAGQEYEIVAAAAGSEEARNYNPSGKIPALVVDDKVIIDSMAICQFIADRHKVCTYEAGTIERARQDSWLHFALDELDSACWWAAKHTFVLPEEYRSADATQGLRVRLFARHGLAGRAPWRQRLCDGRQVHRAGPADRALFGWAIGMHKWQVPEGPLTAYMNRVRDGPPSRKPGRHERRLEPDRLHR